MPCGYLYAPQTRVDAKSFSWLLATIIAKPEPSVRETHHRDALKNFHCDACGALVFFENVTCVKCGHALAFIAERLDLSAVEIDSSQDVHPLLPTARHRVFRFCENGTRHAVCNWLVPAENSQPYCRACELNDVIPNLSDPVNHARWHRLELAKRRLLYTLFQLGLPTDAVPEENRPALRFRFLADDPNGGQNFTGHAAGVITINVAEADDAIREQRRVSLHEPFRTLLGHFRHEAAHYYWERLVARTRWHEPFRQMFGDETMNYGAALDRYYHAGPASDWTERNVSAYASAHPWEDWAETTAHYFHMVDTIETAAGFGVSLQPRHPAAETMTTNPSQVLLSRPHFDELIATWFPLTYALNAFNRGMGLPDLYPFVLSDTAIAKLRFVHEVLSGRRTF